MTGLHNQGGASAPSNVLPFPQTERALHHYENGMAAAGFLTMLLLDRDGTPLPANVQRFDEPEGTGFPATSPELLLALLILESLPAKRQADIKRLVRCQAYAPKAAPSIVKLHNVLSRKGAA